MAKAKVYQIGDTIQVPNYGKGKIIAINGVCLDVEIAEGKVVYVNSEALNSGSH